MKVWREAENIQPDAPPQDVHVSEPVRDPDTGHVISSVVAAALCIKPCGLLTDRQAGKVNALKQGSTVFALMRGLAMRFNGILRSRNSEALDEWIDDAIDTELTAIMWREGQQNGSILWDKVKQRGFEGSKATLYRWVAGRRQKPPSDETTSQRRPPSRRVCAWLLGEEPSVLDDETQRFLHHLFEHAPEPLAAGELARRFAALIRGDDET